MAEGMQNKWLFQIQHFTFPYRDAKLIASQLRLKRHPPLMSPNRIYNSYIIKWGIFLAVGWLAATGGFYV